jgi:hypothetical protein
MEFIIFIIGTLLIVLILLFSNLYLFHKDSINLKPGSRYYYRTNIPYTPKATIIKKDGQEVRYFIDENIEKIYTEKTSDFLNHWTSLN